MGLALGGIGDIYTTVSMGACTALVEGMRICIYLVYIKCNEIRGILTHAISVSDAYLGSDSGHRLAL